MMQIIQIERKKTPILMTQIMYFPPPRAYFQRMSGESSKSNGWQEEEL